MYSNGIRPELIRFADLMEKRLRAHDMDIDPDSGWKYQSVNFLLDKIIHQELSELVLAIDFPRQTKIEDGTMSNDLYRNREISEKAADVANYLMMICSLVGVLDDKSEDSWGELNSDEPDDFDEDVVDLESREGGGPSLVPAGASHFMTAISNKYKEKQKVAKKGTPVEKRGPKKPGKKKGK